MTRTVTASPAASHPATGHGGSTFGTDFSHWLSARGSEIALVTRDLTHHARPPAGPSFTFAVFVVLVAIVLYQLAFKKNPQKKTR